MTNLQVDSADREESVQTDRQQMQLPPHKIRIFGLFAHVDAGKTTTSEAMLYHTGRINRLGRVDEGNTQLDWMIQERERGITITSAATTCQWQGHRLHLIDTPGHVDFSAEVVRSMRIIDGAVIVLCGVGGVEAQTQTVWMHGQREGLPRLIWVNKLDRTGADFDRVVEEVRERLTRRAVAVQIPVGQEGEFGGIVDLLEQRVFMWTAGGVEEGEVAAVLQDRMAPARQQLVEAICETDEGLLERWAVGDEPTPEQLRCALRHATLAGELVPILCGSALRDMGLTQLLDAVTAYLPAPLDRAVETGTDQGGAGGPLCAPVFKLVNDPYMGHLAWVRLLSGRLHSGETVYNPRTGQEERVGRIFRMHANQRQRLDRVEAGDVVALGGVKGAITGDTLCRVEAPMQVEEISFPDPVITVALAPADPAQLERLQRALLRLCQEDPTLVARYDGETGEETLAGLGELHLEIAVDRLRREFQVEPVVSPPQVAYLETVRRRVEAGATYRRQSGGHGHYAQVQLRVEPLSSEGGVVFVSSAPGPGQADQGRGRQAGVPEEFVRHVELGVRQRLEEGPVAGYPCSGVKVTLVSGYFHPVDSCGMDFRIAASMAARQAVGQAAPGLLEPVMRLDAYLDSQYMGAVSGDLGRRHGHVTEVSMRGEQQHLVGQVPLSQVRGYASHLRSMTRGRCAFILEFLRYELVPSAEVELVVEERRRAGKWPSSR